MLPDTARLILGCMISKLKQIVTYISRLTFMSNNHYELTKQDFSLSLSLHKAVFSLQKYYEILRVVANLHGRVLALEPSVS